jgi:DNA polymerase I-like protein with 3'-5' exonuclease and polymerase domains
MQNKTKSHANISIHLYTLNVNVFLKNNKGSAADLIKVAMIKVNSRLKLLNHRRDCKLVNFLHDELM